MNPGVSDESRQQLDQCLSSAVDTQQLCGVSAAVLGRDGLRYQQAFGQRAVDDDQPMTADTVMAVMSMTKALTAAAAMQLVERNKLQLDAPAGLVCPPLESVRVLTGFADSGEPKLRAPRSPVTLRTLLTHTSGFAYNTWNADLLRYMAHTNTPDIATLKKASLALPLIFDPGTAWEYGIGIDWVGQMVEAASGQTLGDYFAAHLTGPLGMTSTAFQATAEMQSRRAPLHKRTDSGALKPLPTRTPKSPEFEMGGGGLLSTVTDYSRFIRMIMNDGALDGVRVLRAESVDAMCRNQIGALQVSPLVSALAPVSNDAEFFPGDPKSWSLGFQVSESDGFTGRKAGTVMWAGLSNCYYWIDRASDLAGIYLTQVLPFFDAHALAHYYDFETAAYRCQSATTTP